MKLKTLIIIVALGILFIESVAQTRDELFGKASIADTSKWTKRGEYSLLKPTYSAFDKMAAAARKEGVTLKIVSAYRSFNRQKGIWERKWNDPSRSKMTAKARALDILKYSSMPSTSRHHWGTDFDLNSVNPAYFETAAGKKIYDWLVKNAPKYGFFQPYTEGRTKGYATEKWHWSYAPISDRYEKKYIETIKNSDIKGFTGAEIAPVIDVIGGWVKLK